MADVVATLTLLLALLAGRSSGRSLVAVFCDSSTKRGTPPPLRLLAGRMMGNMRRVEQTHFHRLVERICSRFRIPGLRPGQCVSGAQVPISTW